jgi:hypothetical protein
MMATMLKAVEVFPAGELTDALSPLFRLVWLHLHVKEERADQAPSDREVRDL